MSRQEGLPVSGPASHTMVSSYDTTASPRDSAAVRPPGHLKDSSSPGHDGDLPRIVPPACRPPADAALLVLAMVVNSVVCNHAFQWDVVGRYFTTAAVLDGLHLTL